MGQPETALVLLSEFFRRSRASAEALAHGIAAGTGRKRPDVPMYRFESGRKVVFRAPGTAFLLRTSVEYANPQLTLEELQGILLARLLEASGTFLANHPGREPGTTDLVEMRESLRRSPAGPVVPFLMNVDDIEPDRYSVNPLRRSIVASGQSGFAVSNVRTEGLAIDDAFVRKYSGSLIATADLKDLTEQLERGREGRYVDLVDATKYVQLDRVGNEIGIDLSIPALRMPLEPLATETQSGPLHRLISAAHATPDALGRVYRVFGHELGRPSTLLPAVPHAPGGAASKRIARGTVLRDNGRLEGVSVRYTPGTLYPNEIDRRDVARAEATATVEVSWDRLRHFDFRETPASPQFALYMLLSPEDGAIWHGVGRYAGSQVVRSYTAARSACRDGEPFEGVSLECSPDPRQWDLVADTMLRHPVYRNIDASVSCVSRLSELLVGSLDLRVLSRPFPEARSRVTSHHPFEHPNRADPWNAVDASSSSVLSP